MKEEDHNHEVEGRLDYSSKWDRRTCIGRVQPGMRSLLVPYSSTDDDRCQARLAPQQKLSRSEETGSSKHQVDQT